MGKVKGLWEALAKQYREIADEMSLIRRKGRSHIDGMPVEIAKIWRAKFRKMRRPGGGRIYSQHTGKLESYERVVYGVFLMVIIESIWFHPASYNEWKDSDCG